MWQARPSGQARAALDSSCFGFEHGLVALGIRGPELVEQVVACARPTPGIVTTPVVLGRFLSLSQQVKLGRGVAWRSGRARTVVISPDVLPGPRERHEMCTAS